MKCDFIKTRTIKDSLYHNKVLMVNVKIDYPSMASNYSRNSMRFNMYYRQKHIEIFTMLQPGCIRQPSNNITSLFLKASCLITLSWLKLLNQPTVKTFN